MGCNTSKGCLINGDDMESHYKYTFHKPPPPIRRIDSHDNNLGPNTTTPTLSVLHGHDMEIQGKRGNDNAHAATRRRLSGSSVENEKMTNNLLLGEAPSFKDYLISSDNHIFNIHGRSSSENEEGEEEKIRRIETPDNYSSVYGSPREAPSPIPIREESANKYDVIVGEACQLPPRDSITEKNRKVEGRRRWVMAREKLKNL